MDLPVDNHYLRHQLCGKYVLQYLLHYRIPSLSNDFHQCVCFQMHTDRKLFLTHVHPHYHIKSLLTLTTNLLERVFYTCSLHIFIVSTFYSHSSQSLSPHYYGKITDSSSQSSEMFTFQNQHRFSFATFHQHLTSVAYPFTLEHFFAWLKIHHFQTLMLGKIEGGRRRG